MNKKENIEQAQIKETRPGWKWKQSVVVFVALPIVCILLIPLGGLAYLCGRLNCSLTLICMLFPAIGVFIIYCFVAGIRRLSGGWKKLSERTKLLIATEIGLPILFVVLFMVPFYSTVRLGLWPPGMSFTYGFRDRIRSRADIQAVRAWLRTLDEEDFPELGDWLPRDKWPESLKALKPPRSVVLEADNNGHHQVRIIWGGGFFHWGVTIGLEIPPSRLNDGYESWLLVEPGVYVWDF